MEYDPIMCMMVDKTTSVKTKDASWKAWTLYINGKFVKSFTSEMPPIREASEFMRENYPGKVGKLSRNTGSSSGYIISGKDSNSLVDKAIKMLDFDSIAALNNFKKTADIGDSTKIQLNNGKVAIVQKEANGWYASIGNERIKGTFKIIEGFLKSQNDNY